MPFSSLLPMADPNDLVIGGWDISKTNLADAMKRAKVLDIALQQQLRPHLEELVPLPSVRGGRSCLTLCPWRRVLFACAGATL